MRAFLALLLAAPLLAGCSEALAQGFGLGALGGEPSGQLGGSTSSLGGAHAPSGGCPAYATTPDLWFNAALETAYADNDPVEPPTNFGSNGDSFVTANTASSPTMEIPCDTGTGFPCFFFDGGDDFRDADSSLSAYEALHDGTGATCLIVYEVPSMAASMTIFGTANGSTANVGINLNRNGVLNQDQIFTANGTGGQPPFSVNDANNEDETHILFFTHGTARTPDVEVRFDQNQDLSADYSFTPSTANHAGRLTIGRRPNATAPFTGHVYEMACWFGSTMSTAEAVAAEEVATCNWTADGSFPE